MHAWVMHRDAFCLYDFFMKLAYVESTAPKYDFCSETLEKVWGAQRKQPTSPERHTVFEMPQTSKLLACIVVRQYKHLTFYALGHSVMRDAP